MSSCGEARLAQRVMTALEKKGCDGVIKLFKKMDLQLDTEIRFEDNLEKMSTLHYAVLRGHYHLMCRLLQEPGGFRRYHLYCVWVEVGPEIQRMELALVRLFFVT